MAPTKKAAWINLIIQLLPIVIGILKPEMLPLANQLGQSIASAEDTHGDEMGETKLKQVTDDVKSNVRGLDSVTLGDVKKIVSATVDTVNIIHDARRKVSK